jgi:hypothetical protein
MSAHYGDSVAMILDPNDHIGTVVETTSDPRGGDATVFQWIGIEEAIRIEAAYQRNTLRRKVTIRNPATGEHWTLLATAGANEDASLDEPISDTWEMDWNYHEKSIWSNPIILTEMRKFRGLDQVHTLQQWKKDMISLAKGEEVVARGATESLGDDVTITFEILKTVASGTFGFDEAVFDLLVEDLLSGVETRTLAQCVLRRTRKVPEDTTIREDNAGRMITDMAAEGLPTDKVFSEPLPEGGFWEKMRPKIQPSTPGAWSLIQEYWHAEDFSVLNFGDPV